MSTNLETPTIGILSVLPGMLIVILRKGTLICPEQDSNIETLKWSLGPPTTTLLPSSETATDVPTSGFPS